MCHKHWTNEYAMYRMLQNMWYHIATSFSNSLMSAFQWLKQHMSTSWQNSIFITKSINIVQLCCYNLNSTVMHTENGSRYIALISWSIFPCCSRLLCFHLLQMWGLTFVHLHIPAWQLYLPTLLQQQTLICTALYEIQCYYYYICSKNLIPSL